MTSEASLVYTMRVGEFKHEVVGPLSKAEVSRLNRVLLKGVGERVREFREVHELSQTELSRISGLDLSVVHHIENGRMNITAQTAVKLALALGMEPWDLYVPRELAPDLRPKHHRQRPPSDTVLKRETRRLLKQIGRRVRELRQLQGMSLMTLEEFTGFSSARLSDIEAGKPNLTTSAVLRLAEAIGVQPHELYVPTEQSGIQPR